MGLGVGAGSGTVTMLLELLPPPQNVSERIRTAITENNATR